MLVIRLTRTGKTHDPHYRIVVQEKRSKLNGKSIDVIGHYHPATAGKQLVVDQEKANAWLAKGAQPSDTVTNLLVKVGTLPEAKKVSNFFNPNKKAEEKVEAPVKTEEAPAETEDAAAEEAPVASATEETSAEEPATEPVDEPAAEAAAATVTETAQEGEEA